MIKTIKLNLNEIIKEQASNSELNDMFMDCFHSMSDKQREESIESLLYDLLQAEIEFNKREHIIEAYYDLINEEDLL